MSQPSFESLGVRAPSSRPTDLRGLRRDLEAGNRVLLRRVQPCVQIRAMPDLGSRVIRFVLATEGVKRDGNSVACNPEAWKLDNYLKNPVVLHAHDYGSPLRPPGLPIGTCVDLFFERVESSWLMVGDARFASHQLAEDTYKLYLPVEQGGDGCGRAVSIGWDPLDYIPLENGGHHFPLNELLEWSTVGIGADPDAVKRMQARGVSGERIEQILNVSRYMENAHGRAYVLDWRDPIDVRSRPADPGTAAPAPASTPSTPAVTRSIDLARVARRALLGPVRSPDGGEQPKRWNTQLSRAFDVTRERYEAGDGELALVARYLDCEVRDIWQTDDVVPSCRMGAFLSGLDETLRDWTVDDVRRIETRQGKPVEFPPVYDQIRLNSTKTGEFVVDGSRFMRNRSETRAIFSLRPEWYGLDVRLYGLREKRHEVAHALHSTWARAADLNFLKGEAFALSGEFLERTNETWDDLFLSEKNAEVLQRQIDLINEKGADLSSRGVILMGPPGTGKTLAGRVMMNQANATFIWISARDFYYSGAFGGFAHGFELARENAPAILFIEDVDNWLSERSIDLLKTEMDGIAQRKGIVTVLTTNFPDRLPRALIDRPGRFHDVLQVDLPDESARARMLTRWLPDLTDEQARAAVVAATAGYSGAHMRELATFASVLREQDGLALDKAVERALEKIAEQRELIDSVQLGKPFTPSRSIEVAMKTLSTRGFSFGRESRIGKKMAGKRLAALKEHVAELEEARESIDDVLESLRAMITELEGAEPDAEPEDPEPSLEPETAAAPPSELARLASELDAAARRHPDPPPSATPPAANDTPPTTRTGGFDDLIGSLRGKTDAPSEATADGGSLGDLTRGLLAAVGAPTAPVQ